MFTKPLLVAALGLEKGKPSPVNWGEMVNRQRLRQSVGVFILQNLPIRAAT